MEHYVCRKRFRRVNSSDESRGLKRKRENKVLMVYILGHYVPFTNAFGLHASIIERDVNKVKELLECGGAAIHLNDTCHLTPLHRAVALGNSDIVKELLKYGSNVDVTNEFGFTPMRDAIIAENLEIVKDLLKYGACVHTLCDSTSTPLKLAVGQRSTEIVEELLKYGSNTNEDFQNCLEVFSTKDLNLQYANLIIKYILVKTSESDEFYFHELLRLGRFVPSLEYRLASRSFFMQCTHEIFLMKSMKANARLSLYEFFMLKNSTVVLSPDDEITRKITNRHVLMVIFPVYSNLIVPKVERGILLNKLNNSFAYTYSCVPGKELERVILNYVCTLSLVRYLCDDDLEAFVQAFSNFD